jgi:predicted hotdog family 3-hydroxylacyl-ACP dehydratase
MPDGKLPAWGYIVGAVAVAAFAAVAFRHRRGIEAVTVGWVERARKRFRVIRAVGSPGMLVA